MEVIPFFGYSVYQMFHMFVFWAVIGWGIEVCTLTLETGQYQNRGFLNGPLCPIYGFGVLMVVIFLRPIEDTFIPLFLTSMIICTTFEFAVGIGMEKLFNNRWWDYSHEKFNIKGYICLKISVLWGLGCVLVVKVVHPLVEIYVDWLPLKLGMLIIIVMSVLIVIDVIGSMTAVNKLNARLKQIDEITKLMLKSSVKIGENISHETLEIKEKYDKIALVADTKANELKEKYDNSKVEFKEKYDNSKQELKEKLEKLMNYNDATAERWMKSFPNMRSVSYQDSFEKVKKSLSNRIKIPDSLKRKKMCDEEYESIVEDCENYDNVNK